MTVSLLMRGCAVAAALGLFVAPTTFAKGTAAELADRLASGDREVRREAAYALALLGSEAKDALPALIKALDDPDKQVWSNAVTAVANIGPEAEAAIPTLIDALNSRRSRGGRERDRRQALLRSAYALTRIGPAAVPPLIAALDADDGAARQGAAKALGGMGPAAREAIPGLIRNLGHPEAAVRSEMIEALSSIGPDSIGALSDALGAKEALMRESSALALAQLGRAAEGTIPRLLTALSEEREPTGRAALLTALSRVGLPPERAAPLLIEALQSTDDKLRHAATNALVSMRSIQSVAVPQLARLLRDTNPLVNERAADILGRYGSAAASAVPELVELAPKGAPSQARVVDALAQIGVVVVPQVVAAVQGETPDALSREHWAVRCLATIGAAALPALNEAMESPGRCGAASRRAGLWRDRSGRSRRTGAFIESMCGCRPPGPRCGVVGSSCDTL
jgi:HEAT repeat protein